MAARVKCTLHVPGSGDFLGYGKSPKEAWGDAYRDGQRALASAVKYDAAQLAYKRARETWPQSLQYARSDGVSDAPHHIMITLERNA